MCCCAVLCVARFGRVNGYEPPRTLRRNLSVPVSVKIRLLDTESDTVEFARRMEKAGACALTVHVRYAATVGDMSNTQCWGVKEGGVSIRLTVVEGGGDLELIPHPSPPSTFW